MGSRTEQDVSQNLVDMSGDAMKAHLSSPEEGDVGAIHLGVFENLFNAMQIVRREATVFDFQPAFANSDHQ